MDDDTSMMSCSIYNLTLDEVQTHLGKPLSSLNLEDLLTTLISAEELHHHHHRHNLNLSPASSSSSSSSSSLFFGETRMGKRTVEEVWREMVGPQQVMETIGETTLEVFLVRAGMMSSRQQHKEWLQFQAAVNNQQMADLDCGFIMEAREGERKRGRYSDEVIERRHKRMIKNRELAARSRARKQAYTNELEHQVVRLTKINNWLRKKKEIERLISSDVPSLPKTQLRRTTSATF